MAYSANTQAKLADLAAQAKALKEEDKKQGNFTTVALQGIASKLLKWYFNHRGEPTLRYWQGNWWTWSDQVWRPMKINELSRRIAAFATEDPSDDPDRPEKGGLGLTNLPKNARDEIITFLPLMCKLPDSQDFQTWLPAEGKINSDLDESGTWINCSQGLLKAADTSKPQLFQATPRYFTPVLIPRKTDQNPPKAWLSFLNEVLEGDTERIAVIQEWFGYCSLPTTRYHKMLMMVGSGGNGKSVVLHVLEQMLGTHNCSHVELSDMNTTFGPFNTLGKAANICGDIATRYLKNPGRIKAFVGGDCFRFEDKYISAFSAMPTAKLVFSMNELPKTDDESDGFWRRMLPMPFTFKPKQEDPIYSNPDHPNWPFRDELDAIFTWALEGLIRLNNKQQFSGSTVITALAGDWRLGNEGVRRYALERLEFDKSSSHATICDVISIDYAKWALKNRERPFSAQGFGKRLRRVFPDLITSQKRLGQKKVNQWPGLRIRQDAPHLGGDL